MKRRSTHRRFLVLGPALALACSATPNVLPTNSFNRPTDMAFMCLGAFGMPDGDGGEQGPFQVSGRPMRACHNPPTENMRQTPIPSSMHNRTFAFVPSSASGDLTVIDADRWKLVDLNRATGGFGRAPLGTLPEQISTTSDGCRLMSANRGSCDLALVDPSALLAGVFETQYGNVKLPAGNGLQRITPRTENQTLFAAAPYEAVFLPRDTTNPALCPMDGAAPDVPYRALVTFPSCDLIALVDLPSGDIVASAKVGLVEVPDPNDMTQTQMVPGLVNQGKSPQCPADCGEGRADGGSRPIDARYRPAGIAITPAGDRAYVSLSSYPGVISVGLTPDTLVAPGNVIELNDGAEGSNRIRLSVNPYAYETTTVSPFVGRFVGSAGANRKYLYAIAGDGSLRIVDVSVPGFEKECATNFDPLLNVDATGKPLYNPDMACIAYVEAKSRAASTPVAFPFLPTAGLRFPSLPVDIAAADLSATLVEETVNGAYAWVLTATGAVYLVNIEPTQRQIKAVVHDGQDTLFDPKAPTDPAYWVNTPYVYRSDPANLVKESLPFPNRPRDRNVMSYSASLDVSLGPTRLDSPPLGPATGPYIEPFYTQGTEDNATALDNGAYETHVFFPDREAAIAQGWDVTWQGTVVGPRYSGLLRGAVLTDGANFCGSGVLLGDIVTLNGCTNDAQCPLGMLCQRDPTLDQVSGGLTVTGLCISKNLAAAQEETCAPYAASVRRYEIVDARNSQLTLAPHLDEVVRSSLSPCHPPGTAVTGTGGAGGTACPGTGGTGGTGGMGGAGGTAGGEATCKPFNDCFDTGDSSTSAFQCIQYGSERRCLNPCTNNGDCRNGRVCLRTCAQDRDCPSGGSCAPDGMCRAELRKDDAVCTLCTCAAGESCRPKANDPTTNVCHVNTAEGWCAGDQAKSCDPAKCCQPGQTCVGGQCEINSFCADGPPLKDNVCFPQLTAYQVHANASFMVSGGLAGSFSAGKETEYGCEPQTETERDERLVSRIPLRPRPVPPQLPPRPNGTVPPPPVPAVVECGAGTFPTLKTDPALNEQDGYYIDHFDPRIAPVIESGLITPKTRADGTAGFKAGPYNITQEAPQLVDWMKQWMKNVKAPNACLYLGGPIEGDDPSTADPTGRACRPQHVRARFRNSQVAFVLANIDRAPPGSSTIHFNVHGGFRQQAVNLLTTVEISAPARLVLGPIDSNPMITTVTNAPYFFVVDQRRLGRGQGGGATRGQILRINPYGQSTPNMGYLPTYEDYTRTGGLFPIQ